MQAMLLPNITFFSYFETNLKPATIIFQCVHRDVAARNVLLGENHQPMVSDFGLSRDIYESGQYEKTTGV